MRRNAIGPKMCAYGLTGQRGPNLQIHTSYLRILLEAKILYLFYIHHSRQNKMGLKYDRQRFAPSQ